VIESGGHIPVYGPDIIAELILSHFGELHPSPLEDAVVFAGEDLVDHPPGLNLYQSDFFEKLARVHAECSLVRETGRHPADRDAGAVPRWCLWNLDLIQDFLHHLLG
jgi:hypothetical protein